MKNLSNNLEIDNYSTIITSKIEPSLIKQKLIDEVNNKYSIGSFGALVEFSGYVRNSKNYNSELDHLLIEQYQGISNKFIDSIISNSYERFNILGAIASHRIGKIPVGEIVVYVATISQHRKRAYKASNYLIETIKSKIPLWKAEVFKNGKVNWIDSQNNIVKET